MSNRPLPKPNKKLRVSKKKHKPYADSTRRKYWKDSERDLGTFLLNHDDQDPKFAPALSKRGRIGHITGLEMDTVTLNWVGENKQVETLPKWINKAILKIIQRGKDHGKYPLLRLDVTQELTKEDLGKLFNSKSKPVDQLSQVEQRLVNNDLGLKRLPDLAIIPISVLGELLALIKSLQKEE